jgi:hypothetical protein
VKDCLVWILLYLLVQTTMKKLQLSFFLIAILTFFFIFEACNKSTLVGGELLEGDKDNVVFSDTFSLKAATVANDTIKNISYEVASAIFPCGNYEDATFGKSSTTLYMQHLLSGTPKLSSVILDSAVLSMTYDTLGGYGDLTQPMTFTAYRMTENWTYSKDFFSYSSFGTEAQPLGTVTIIPKYKLKDSITVLSILEDSKTKAAKPIKVVSHLRIRLDDAFGKEFLNTIDSTVNKTFDDKQLLEKFKGIELRPAASNKGMVYFRANVYPSNSGNPTGTNLNTNISFYYKVKTKAKNGADSLYRDAYSIFPFSNQATTEVPVAAKVLNVQHQASNFIKNAIATKIDTTLYMEGLTGSNIKVQVPNINTLKNVVINKAELVISSPNSDIRQILVDPTNDKSQLGVFDSQYLAYSGLSTTNATTGIKTYKMNITEHVQRIVNGTEENTFFLSVFPKIENPSRGIFYGPNHPKYPMKLKITYTKLK